MNHGRLWKYLVFVAVFIVASCQDAVPPAGPDLPNASKSLTTDGPVLEGPNVIEYEHLAVLENVTKYILQGEHSPGGGCKFSGAITLGGQQTSITELELAFDPDTCRSLIAKGVLVESGDQTDPGDIGTSTDTVSVDFSSSALVHPSSTASSSLATTSSLGTWYGEIHNWFEDPPGLHVNDAINFIYWAPDGSCAYAGGAQMGYRHEWLGETGWSLESHTWNKSATCDKVYSGSVVHFVNGIFCLGMNTDTWYDENYIEGHADASIGTRWKVRKAGTCAFLLSANRTVTREQI